MLSYIISYTARLLMRRAVHAVVDGDRRGIVNRMRKNPTARAVIDEIANPKNPLNRLDTMPARTNTIPKWRDMRTHTSLPMQAQASTLIFMPTHDPRYDDIAVRVGGKHKAGLMSGDLNYIDGVALAYGRPTTHNDAR